MSNTYDLRMNVPFQGWLPVWVHQCVGARYEMGNISLPNPVSKGDRISYPLGEDGETFLGRVDFLEHDTGSSVITTSRVITERSEMYALDELLQKHMKRSSSNFESVI